MAGYDLSAFVSGGYLLARLTEAGKERPPSRLLPPRYLSGSSCLCDFFPSAWVWSYAGPQDQNRNFIDGISHFEDRLKSVEKFGIRRENLTELVRWGQFAFGREFGMPNIFYTLESARRSKKWISVPEDELALIGLALPRSLRNEFLHAPQNNEGAGIHECVERNERPAETGQALGFELLNLEHGELCHSWICNGLEKDFTRDFQLSLNSHGYLDSLDDALRCTGPLNRGEIGAEPPPWFPWLIIEYK